jgi:hypothetical protein
LESERDIPPHHLVAGFHVAQVLAIQHVRHPGDKLVAQAHQCLLAGERPHAVDHVRPAALDNRHQPRQVLRVVLKIGILDDDELAAGGLQCGTDRGALAAIDAVMNDLDVGTGKLLD